ncbi:LOW QUALITY PROTEIN: pentatricopeptide repeat-containing protein At4g19191, mitochondrial-like [Salvia miltiorrhiza]|uniref:LOW QUALITY PROTEIN: pentatricopeptide repeat-containing protein At4g19191, mitochondrial-like n=1 Tax=Salvia miltiorrhiza TaxID=226208 RepID=UPI0025AC275E|nr:LOW QUALITY PROTEIN: pentatricopeptide repeat-containing protein At4g19191, mitochondrial-like [Salvia miltiorrhiza]
MLNRFSVASWNSCIRQSVYSGDFRKAILLFTQMKNQSHLYPDNLTFPFVAKACAKLSDLKLSRMIHAHIVKTPYCWDVYVHTALVDMYVKCGRLGCAQQMAGSVKCPCVVASWNALVVGFARAGVFDRVSLLFNRMRAARVVPDAVTLMGLTHLLSGMKDSMLLGGVHCFGMKCGLEKDVLVANTLIAGYAKCRDLCSAEKVFLGIALDCLSVVSWNAMIAGFAYFEEWLKAIKVYIRMLRDGFRPDASTILNLLSSMAQQSDSLLCGRLVHAHGVKIGCDADITVLNTLVCMYSKCGAIDSARYIFDCMNVRSCVTWTVMIGAYADKGDLDEVLSLFHEMEAAGEKPDSVTVFHLIAACGKVGGLEVGRWIDGYTTAKGLKKDLMVCNALIDMYAKCGSMAHAHNVFLAMDETNVVSWTALISGFALNGRSREALDHFDRMLESGVRPNHVTFLAVLQACTHAGLLEKGWELFNMMTNEYHWNPGLDHYACVADLFGRRGKLKEALDFIQEMPFTPDAGIWGALLSACKIHHNLDIGEHAARHLFRLEPQAAAPYVEMANIYALANEWSGVAAMRVEMKSKQVAKTPGQSIVHIDGKCYSFTVEDRFHPNRCKIFETLDNLVLQLRDDMDISPCEEFQS